MSRKKKPLISGIEIITDKPCEPCIEEAHGWGDEAQSLFLPSAPVCIKIHGGRNGYVCQIRVKEDGSLQITNFEGHYTSSHGSNMELTNHS